MTPKTRVLGARIGARITLPGLGAVVARGADVRRWSADSTSQGVRTEPLIPWYPANISKPADKITTPVIYVREGWKGAKYPPPHAFCGTN